MIRVRRGTAKISLPPRRPIACIKSGFCQYPWRGASPNRYPMTTQLQHAPTRRDFAIIALAGISALAAGGASAAAPVQISPEEALKALDPWADALITGDPVVVEKVLAPEF